MCVHMCIVSIISVVAGETTKHNRGLLWACTGGLLDETDHSVVRLPDPNTQSQSVINTTAAIQRMALWQAAQSGSVTPPR